jgi:predicted secreted protein
MGPLTLTAIFITIWWTVLFAVLPLGMKNHAEMGLDLPEGCDPGAPVKTNLKKKAITTTWISVIVFVLLLVVIHTHIIPMPNFPSQR